MKLRAGRAFVIVGLWIAAGWWVATVHPLTGPVLFIVTETHGVHAGDLPAVALGAAPAVRRLGRAVGRATFGVG